MTLWELGNMHRGMMLQAGWPIRRWYREVERTNVNDILLTLNPKSATDRFRSDMNPKFEDTPMIVGNMVEAAGIPLE